MAEIEPLEAFLSNLEFQPDRFQLEAIEHLEAGRSLVVTAPTGAGKTLVAEAAVALARLQGKRAFYTTPVKALSNQKLVDFGQVYGDDVGLLTGDNVINGDAPIIVMTTEVLRNMIYADSPALDDLGVVILDEVHYLQDRYRGSVWEEVIIHLPRSIQLVNLSATIANAGEFTEWMSERRGPTALVEEVIRPVPLDSYYMVADRHRENGIEMWPMAAERGRGPNQDVVRRLKKGRGRNARFHQPRRVAVVNELRKLRMLPAMFFIFSRAGCDQASTATAEGHLGLVNAEEKAAIASVIATRLDHLSEEDLTALGVARWSAMLEQGVAAHHAGLVPAFKETVEELFSKGLIKVVFATETLALGINMPAKTVVIERLSKFNGESHELLLPGDYTQLTGRAGRRGIDDSGTGIVLFQRDIPFDRVASIASSGSHPLVSSFAPSYNMAVNLISTYEQDRAEELLTASFGQHRLESRRRSLSQRLEDKRAEQQEFLDRASCELGDVATQLASSETSTAAIRQQLRDFAHDLLEGDVLEIATADGPDRAVVIGRSYGPNPKLSLVDLDGTRRTIKADELPPTVASIGAVALPEPYRPDDRGFRRDAARAGRLLEPVDDRRVALSVGGTAVAACPKLGDHMMWLDRAAGLDKEIKRLDRRIGSRDGGLVVWFRNILKLLEHYDYVDGWRLTERGERLRFIYNELDLLIAEVIRQGVLDDLGPGELAGIASMFVYEARRNDTPGGFPSADVANVANLIHDIADDLAEQESKHRLEPTRPPDDGYVERMYDWSEGAALDDLFGDEAAAGDFVRIARQTLDLLRQLRDSYPNIRSSAARAIDRIDRGVVAAGGGATAETTGDA